MAGIGGESCDYVRMDPPELKEAVVVRRRPGLDGYHVQKLGLGKGEFVATAVLKDTAANVKTWREAIAAMQGTTVSIVDDWDETHTYCRIVDVSLPRRTPFMEGSATTYCRGEITVRGVKEQ